MKTIILDTNFLLIPVQFKIDIIEEIRRICNFPYGLAVVDKTLDELEKLNKGKTKPAVGVAKLLIKKNKIRIIKTDKQKHVDLLIIDYCSAHDCVVATQDSAFREMLREKEIPVIMMRQKSHLEVAGL